MVTSCGFSPVYQASPGEVSASRALQFTKVSNIENRLGQQLRQFLIEKMNPTGEPDKEVFRLNVTLSEKRKNLGVEADTSTTFSRLTVTAKYKLINAKTKQVLLDTSARSVNSYNVVNSPYATQVAEQDARERAIREISENIYLRLGIFFKSYDYQAPSS